MTTPNASLEALLSWTEELTAITQQLDALGSKMLRAALDDANERSIATEKRRRMMNQSAKPKASEG